MRLVFSLWVCVVLLGVASGGAAQSAPVVEPGIEPLRLAIDDLIETFGNRYAQGEAFLRRLAKIETVSKRPAGPNAKRLSSVLMTCGVRL